MCACVQKKETTGQTRRNLGTNTQEPWSAARVESTRSDFVDSGMRHSATVYFAACDGEAGGGAQSSCNCSDHQTFACLCMRGRGRKLVAIQTEACVCSWGGASACCSEPCGDLLTELLSPVGRKRLTLRMLDKVSETAAGLSA